MAEESSNYNSKFENEVKSAVVGEKNIIYNYFYYREEARVEPIDSAITTDEYLPCPYRGLFHFGPNDAEFFFGREIFIEELYSATKTKNFIPVLGASGSGKSSVVLAGLVPKLQKTGHWQFTHFRPGSDQDPFYSLAEALVPLYREDTDSTDKMAQASKLARDLKDGTTPLLRVFSSIQRKHPNHRLLLIADQFEEIYTLCNNQQIRRQFLDCLLASLETPASVSSSATVLVTTMRADFLGNALSYRPFADILQNADVKLGPMNREELTQVIEKPAQKLGVTFADGLVKRILNDVENQPGNLPLLEFALTELWNKRSGKQLTHKIYEEIGQVEGALARHADEKYGNLTDEEKEKVRRIFIQLVRPGEGAEDTRRIAMKAELGEQSWSLVKKLADARLVVTSRNLSSQETVEVVHEALIRNWGELREWMNTNRVFRAWQERLRSAKGEWEATNKDSGSLLRGAVLAVAEEQLKKRPEDLIDEKEFIEQSIKEGNRLKQVEAARRKREIRTAWGIAAGSVVAVVISSGLGLTAWNQKKQKKQSELNLAKSLGTSSLSQFNGHQELEAFVTAIKGGKIFQQQNTSNPEVMTVLQESLYGLGERNRLINEGDVKSVAFSLDGEILASVSAGQGGTVKLWNLEGKELQTLLAHQSKVRTVAFSPNRDNQILASAGDDGTVKLWKRNSTGQFETQPNQTLNGHKAGVNSVVFSRDNQILASASDDGTVKLWKRNSTGQFETQPNQTLISKDNVNFTSIAFSLDGKMLASAGNDNNYSSGFVYLWKRNSIGQFETQGALQGDTGEILSVAFSPDGKTIATGNESQTVTLWKRDSTGQFETQPYQTLSGHAGWVWSVAFSPDNQILASAGDRSIKLWNLKGKEQLSTFNGHRNWVWSVAFSPDNQILAFAGDDTTIKLWNLEGKELQTLPGHQSTVRTVAFSPNRDNQILASAGDDGTIKLWKRNSMGQFGTEPDQTLDGDQAGVWSVVFSPDRDNQILASIGHYGTIKLWKRNSTGQFGTQPDQILRHQATEGIVAFSSDNQILASTGDHGTIKLWKRNSTGQFETQPDQILISQAGGGSVAFSPDSKTIATANADTSITLWKRNNTGQFNTQPDQTLRGHTKWVTSLAFSPDGEMLASASQDRTVKLWNLKGEELLTLYNPFYGDVQDWLRSVAFSPDGKKIAAGGSSSQNMNVIMWRNLDDLQLNKLIVSACNGVRDYLRYSKDIKEENDRHLCDGLGSDK
ncbi:nSTAND1 domain-containing NTPase [Nostoc sp.]|uniref:nSTAND1 domain-containing NTPase n=1 Tax=Nostoc sp. TaxID=1180 RepID=UPI002FF768DB